MQCLEDDLAQNSVSGEPEMKTVLYNGYSADSIYAVHSLFQYPSYNVSVCRT